MAALPSGSRIVLIVDDDPLILDILRRMMASMTPGAEQTAVFAQTYAEALSFIARYEVATLFTDYTLDEGSGMHLIRRVRKRFPHAVTILCSGLDVQELRVGGVHVSADHYLSKPYNMAELVRLLSTALY